jgi:hypothetical protein
MKLAAYFSRDGADHAAVVRRMLRAQTEGSVKASEPHGVGGGALGWVATSDAHAPFPLAYAGRSGNLLFVSGTPIHLGGSLTRLLSRAAELSSAEASRVLKQLDGAFAAIHWDAAAGRLTVVTDFLGMQPLYVAREGGALVLATDLRGVAASAVVDLEPDPAAWGAFYTLGHAIGDLTFFKGVRRADAGAELSYDSRSGELERSSYWRWPEPAPSATLADVDTGAIVEALAQSVDGYRAYDASGVVLLSGGFDSRLVLHLLRRAEIPARALVVRHRDENDDADGRYAVRAAKLAGVEYDVCTPQRDFYGSPAYQRYLERSENANTSFGLFIAQVSAFIRPEMRAVWDGLAPQAMRKLSYPVTGGFAPYVETLRRKAAARLRADAAEVFTGAWADAMYEGFLDALRAETARYPDDEFGVAEFSVRNRTRIRVASNPLRVYAMDVLPFTPGLTREFYGLVGRLGSETKGRDDLALKLFRDHFPEALRVPFCSGSRLATGGSGLSPGFRIAAVRAALWRSYYVRRALQRARVYTPFSFDLAPALSAMLRRVDAGDPYLKPGLAGEARPLDGLALTESAAHQLFYWQAAKAIAPGAVPAGVASGDG